MFQCIAFCFVFIVGQSYNNRRWSYTNESCATVREMDNEEQPQKKSDIIKGDKEKWGYAVCFGTIITFIAGIGHVNSFGLIYNDFIIDTHSTAKSLTTAHGMFAVMLALGGIIVNVIFKQFSLRFGGLLGSVIFSVGSLTTIFISNTNQLPFTFGVMQGIGFGMMVPVCYSTLNHYYVKKRTTVMSICKAIQGIILMGYPQLLKWVMSSYGFRGTLLIIFGISLHTIPGMMAMKAERQTNTIRTANLVENGTKENESVDLLGREENIQIKNDSNRPSRKIYINKFLDILNINVLKDPVYCNICVCQSFVNFSDLTFFILQPMLLLQIGFTKEQVAMCISICAGADVAGRCGLALISNFIQVNTRWLFYVSTLFTFFIRIVILQVHDFIWIAVVTAVLGLLRSCLHVASPLVISNYVSHQDFPAAYAIFILITGLVNVVFGPLVGLLKDVYDDYSPTFYALCLCCAPCLLSWPIEFIFRK